MRCRRPPPLSARPFGDPADAGRTLWRRPRHARSGRPRFVSTPRPLSRSLSRSPARASLRLLWSLASLVVGAAARCALGLLASPPPPPPPLSALLYCTSLFSSLRPPLSALTRPPLTFPPPLPARLLCVPLTPRLARRPLSPAPVPCAAAAVHRRLGRHRRCSRSLPLWRYYPCASRPCYPEPHPRGGAPRSVCRRRAPPTHALCHAHPRNWAALFSKNLPPLFLPHTVAQSGEYTGSGL